MEISFDGLRISLAQQYNQVIKKLEAGKLPTVANVIVEDKNGNSMVSKDGDIIVHRDDLIKDLGELKKIIGILACVYDDKNGEYESVSDQIEDLKSI